MAQSKYIEARDGDTWASVSGEFGDWLIERNLDKDFGWSKGDVLTINKELSLFCFDFPDRHGEKIKVFEEWAESTGRLYGIKSGCNVVFPNSTNLNLVLPPEQEIEVPPWLK